MTAFMQHTVYRWRPATSFKVNRSVTSLRPAWNVAMLSSAKQAKLFLWNFWFRIAAHSFTTRSHMTGQYPTTCSTNRSHFKFFHCTAALSGSRLNFMLSHSLWCDYHFSLCSIRDSFIWWTVKSGLTTLPTFVTARFTWFDTMVQ